MNIGRLVRRLKSPPWSLAISAWLGAALVQTGAFGTVDTTRRYQVTRALWRGEAPVPPSDFPGYGLLAWDGQVHAWYGIGQSLVMLPADLAAGGITGLFGLNGPLRLKIESGLVAFGTFPLIAALNAVLGYLLLRRLGGFERRVAVLGVLAWLFTTTVLPYSQAHYENSLDLFCSLVIVLATFRWAKDGQRWALAAAALASGLNVLVRLSNVVDSIILTGGSLVAAALSVPGDRGAWLRSRFADLVRIWMPITGLSLLADRAYHVARFGWDQAFSTYIHLFGVQARATRPELPADYPFSGSFVQGFVGPLVSPNRSVLLFDPLALAGIALFGWAIATRRLSQSVTAVLAAFGVGLLARLVFYAKYAHWAGGTSWSNRFTLTPLQLALLFVVPTFLVMRKHLSRTVRGAFIATLALAGALQLSSILVNPDLENIQSQCDERPLLAIPHRVLNVTRVLSNVDPDDLSRHGCVPEEFRRPNLLPWGNARELPNSLRRGALFAWLVLFFAWVASLVSLLRGAKAESGRTTNDS
jgi:hypothetical protein